MSAPTCATRPPSSCRSAARTPIGCSAALRRAAPWFRARVSEKAGLRSAPEIRFQLDRTFDEADKIDALLRRPDVARDLEEA